MTAPRYTTSFAEALCRDGRAVGGKAAGLAEMTVAGLPVAPGFTVCSSAYRAFLDGGLRAEVERELAGVDSTRPATLERAARALRERLSSAPIPLAVADPIRAAYRKLGAQVGADDLDVAVRSSATAEDSARESFAGEFETYVDISGEDDVLGHVHRCWASVFSGRALGYALNRGISPLDIEMAVVVQKTVRAAAAGVMFTLSPVTGDRSRIVLEASWGLGLSIVGGEVTPDRYVVDKITLSVVERVPGDKRVEYRRGDAADPVARERWATLCLDDEHIVALARLGKRLERLHRRALDIEFAVESDLAAGSDLVLLQCRPETVWSARKWKPAFDATAGLMSWISHSVGGAGSAAVPGQAGHRHG